MAGKSTIKTLIIAGSVLFFIILSFSAVFTFSGYLSTTEKINANILLVEGWLPPDGMEAACHEFRTHSYDYIVTTGLEADFDGGFMYSRGFLIFYPREKLSSNLKTGRHLIEVKASSEMGGENAACFRLYINDSVIANFTTSKREKNYPVYWQGSLATIDSITIEFTNDFVGDFGDRNLFIREIIIDKKIIIPTLNYSEYDIDDLDGKERIKNNFTSYASKAKTELLRLGVDTTFLIAVPGVRTNINRTLASALAVRDWVNKTNIKITGINIFSYGMHARRSWMIYSKILGKSFNIGIVSLPDNLNQTRTEKTFETIRETLGIFYYWVILIPY
jgi:hypothetical protein